VNLTERSRYICRRRFSTCGALCRRINGKRVRIPGDAFIAIQQHRQVVMLLERANLMQIIEITEESVLYSFVAGLNCPIRTSALEGFVAYNFLQMEE
jgi:hypothetical protein